MKDHEIALIVNELRSIATKFHSHQSLRERLANLIVPHLKEVKDHTGTVNTKTNM